MAESSDRVVVQQDGGEPSVKRRAVSLARAHKPLHSEASNALVKSLIEKATEPEPEGRSNQHVDVGQRQPHPYDFQAVTNFQTVNTHHSACIFAKVNSTVGLGFASRDTDESGRPDLFAVDRVSELLDPLCTVSFSDVLSDVCEDFYQVGIGYMEVVRDAPEGDIVGLHHIPAWKVWAVVEDRDYNTHYEICDSPGAIGKRFPCFGDFDFEERIAEQVVNTSTASNAVDVLGNQPGTDRYSSVIAFRSPTSLSRFYGYARWLSAVPAIELVRCMDQHFYDFFLNRGVPEMMLFVIGQKLNDDDWKQIEDAMKANIGQGNSHKSTAINIEGTPETVQVQLEKLALEGTPDDNYVDKADNLAMRIVSAHQVPPLLAGIQIPGKLGASNELANSLTLFQTVVCGPAQVHIKSILAKTLANDTIGVQGLSVEDLRFNTILDYIDVLKADTMGRMREEATTATAQGRDLREGVRD